MGRILVVVVVALLAAAAVGVSGGAGSARAGWLITDLGTLGGTYSWAVAINERGQVVGSSETRGCKRDHAFLWQMGKMRDLGSDLGGSSADAVNARGDLIGGDEPIDCDGSDHMYYTSFIFHAGKRITLGDYVEVQALNDSTQVVGIDKGSRNASQAFLWQRGKMTPLDSGPKASAAADVNARGQVVGVVGTDAVLWEHGSMRKLGNLPGKKGGVALAINDRGWVIGFSYARLSDDISGGARTYFDGSGPTPIGVRGFLWRGGTLLDLGVLPGNTMSMPIGINNRGQVIAVSYSKTKYGSPSSTRAFLWQSGTTSELPSLPGGKFTWVNAISNGGQVIGFSYSKEDHYGSASGARAFIWDNGTTTELPSLPGGKSSSPSAINNRNQIVGSSTTKNGYEHAVLWTLRSTS